MHLQQQIRVFRINHTEEARVSNIHPARTISKIRSLTFAGPTQAFHTSLDQSVHVQAEMIANTHQRCAGMNEPISPVETISGAT